MLQALAEHSVVPDLVTGTSVGSLNGAVVALDPVGAANRLGHLWRKLAGDTVFPGGLFSQARTLQKSKTYLFPSDGLGQLIDDFLGPNLAFEDLALPFGAVAVDVETTKPHLMTTGPLAPALAASAAIPGLYPAVAHEGRLLYDGGLVANVPLRQAVALGARSLVVLDCNFPGHLPSVPQTLADVLMFASLVAIRSQASLEVPAVAREMPVVYLPGPPPQKMTPLDFSRTAALVEGAYQAARPFLDDLVIEGPGLYGRLAGHE